MISVPIRALPREQRLAAAAAAAVTIVFNCRTAMKKITNVRRQDIVVHLPERRRPRERKRPDYIKIIDIGTLYHMHCRRVFELNYYNILLDNNTTDVILRRRVGINIRMFRPLIFKSLSRFK